MTSNGFIAVVVFLLLVFTYIVCYYNFRRRWRKRAAKVQYSHPLSNFQPEQALVDFAKSFSDMFNDMGPGNYSSPCYKYNISLAEEFGPEAASTPIRVNLANGLILMSKKALLEQKATADYLFYQIIWCVVSRYTSSIIVTDLKTIGYYGSTGRSVKAVVEGMQHLLGDKINEFNKERLLLLQHYL